MLSPIHTSHAFRPSLPTEVNECVPIALAYVCGLLLASQQIERNICG